MHILGSFSRSIAMRVVILAAGYGTRLQRDLATSERYSHLRGVAKPLLPINDSVLLDRWMVMLDQLGGAPCREVVVVVNVATRGQFADWLDKYDGRLPVRLVVDSESVSEHSRSGAIACMKLGVGDDLVEDALFIGGDTLLASDFSLENFLRTARDRCRQFAVSAHVVAVPCATEHVHRHGIIEVSTSQRVTSFLEKPSPSETDSRVQCPCFYWLSADSLHLLDKYLATHSSLARRDATGLLVAYLVDQCAVFAYNASKRYDIGSLDSYLSCCQELALDKQPKLHDAKTNTEDIKAKTTN